MDIAYNKVDQNVLPISQDRVSASEYNQIAASLMHIITASGFTPDPADNAQLLAALGPRIVETYSNGTSWYRVYSDGWCEQGGYTSSISSNSSSSVLLLKSYTDTNYQVICQRDEGTSAATTNYEGGNVGSKTTSQFTLWNGMAVEAHFSWQACGYIS